MNISIKLNNIQDSRRNHFQKHSLETIIYWVFKFQKNLCAVLSQIAWRLRHSNKRRCTNIELRSEAKHCSSLCSQSEGDEYCGGQTRLKIQQSHALKR